MNIAVIPARSGSKRIPNKNIRTLANKPIIGHTIDTAIKAQLFDQIIVSTDDQQIADIALQYGAAAPFLRPSFLSDDYTPTVPVIAHAITSLIATGASIDYVCCIYPTAALVSPDDLRGSLAQLTASSEDYCLSIVETNQPLHRSLAINKHNKVMSVFPENQLKRTQDLEATYFDAGQFYWGTAQSWLTVQNIHSSATGFVLPPWRAVDIDTESDWTLAEVLFYARDRFIKL